jgi:hypothetical protein
MYSNGLQSMLHFEILAECIRRKGKTGSRNVWRVLLLYVGTETESAVQWIERFSSGLTRQLKGKRPARGRPAGLPAAP